MGKVTRPHQIRRMLDLAEVYWIRKQSHTDMFSEGYVGVTSRTAQERYQEHVYAAQCRKGKKSVIHKAIIALGKDNLVVQTICICTEEYAYWLENKLRPEQRIGWNVSIGGEKPPGVKGLPVSEETRKKLSEAHKGRKMHPNSRVALDKANKGRKLSDEQKAAISKFQRENSHKFQTEKKRQATIAMNIARRGEKRSDEVKERLKQSHKDRGYWNLPKSNRDVWAMADVFYEDFLTGMRAWSICKKHGLSPYALESILKHFNNGWIPLEDDHWLSNFKKEGNE